MGRHMRACKLSNCIIRKTFPCNIYPLKPHFYIVTQGFAGVHLFFLSLLQNIDCGYSLEPPRRGGSNVYPQSMFGAKIRKISFFFSRNFQFLHLKKSLYIAWASFRNDGFIKICFCCNIFNPRQQAGKKAQHKTSQKCYSTHE